MSIEEQKQEGQVSMEDTLIREYQLKVIKPSQAFELPKDLDFNALNEVGIDEEDARDTVQSIVDFQNMPIIIDQFNKDHTARRECRKQIEAKYGNDALSFLESNKLKVNSYSFINNIFANLYIRKTLPSELLLSKVNSIRQRYDKITQGYAEMDINDKIDAVGKLDKLFGEVIELLRIETP